MKKLSDIALVSYLRCKGFKIQKIERLDKRTVFCFDETSSLDVTLLEYYNHEAQIDPLEFYEMLRNSKTLTRQ